ncbi:energy-coupled thiamine transporter ThiT [Psychrobacillus vulpis]|uniref:Energy-coupled thiamine transporter ThiT n=1 Tax=Psychrobacillus vulpis TaxID=2325572 RepID=A0A544TPG3_9BACI|nr:energy-coupled thiamine transporter ThiT [Psychrobacillus vulpis]TQR19341.1 energy-coupled thiamine transporter ThiT [Psychrobacillus vulpis]
MKNQRVLLLVEIAIFAALGYILDIIGFGMPQGGTVTFVLVPVILIAFRRGVVAGLITGLLIGLLQVVTGRFYAAPLSFEIVIIQVAIDYFIAFMVAGFAGFFRPAFMKAFENKDTKKMVTAVIAGTFVAALLRYFAHVLSGILFFGEFAGDQNVIIYSLVYNSTYMIPVFLLAAFICTILFVKAPRLVLPN